MSEYVRVVDDDGDGAGVRTVVLDRPAKLNTLTPDDLRAVQDAVHGADGRGVVFTGAGERAFGAGMDVHAFRDLDDRSARELIMLVRDTLAVVRTAPVATAAMVNGYCLGVAFELAMVCDVRVAVPAARFGLPEVAVGIPSIADAALLSQHVGLGLAREITLTGEPYPVEAFTGTGFLNRVVEPAELEQSTRELLGRITRHSPTVIASQKRLFEVWQNHTLVDGAAISVDEFATVVAEPDTRRRIEDAITRLDG